MKVNYRFRYTLMGVREWKTVTVDQSTLGIAYRIDDIREDEDMLECKFLDYVEDKRFTDFLEGLPGEDADRCEIKNNGISVSILCGGEEFCRVDKVTAESGEWSADELEDDEPESLDTWMRSVIPSQYISA